MSTLRFPSPFYADLSGMLLSTAPDEACGVAFARHVEGVWIVCEAAAAPPEAYEARDGVSATLESRFVSSVADRCRAEGLCAVFVHTHPAATGASPAFSEADDAGERALAPYMHRRAGEGPHLALVVGPNGCRARVLGGTDEVEVREIGREIAFPSEDPAPCGPDERHDRQERAFGAAGQRKLPVLRVGIVGAGGTGSVVLQQLAHLGVLDFTVVEPDVVEVSNLNRLVGASGTDVGRGKLEVAERLVRSIAPEAAFEGLARDVTEAGVASALTALDFLFLCTDSQSSRAVVGQLAYQYLVPTIDMGVAITVARGRTTHVNGRVQMLAPGLECLLCASSIDPEGVRREMLTVEQRAVDPYVQGIHEPQPAVISLNSTVSSLAVTMFLGAVTPIPATARFQLYDAVRGHVRTATAARMEGCPWCSARGALAKGPSWPLPARPRAVPAAAPVDEAAGARP